MSGDSLKLRIEANPFTLYGPFLKITPPPGAQALGFKPTYIPARPAPSITPNPAPQPGCTVSALGQMIQLPYPADQVAEWIREALDRLDIIDTQGV